MIFCIYRDCLLALCGLTRAGAQLSDLLPVAGSDISLGANPGLHLAFFGNQFVPLQIAAGQAPGEVYQSCGFGDYANFYRAFKGEYGISPREFAAQVQ